MAVKVLVVAGIRDTQAELGDAYGLRLQFREIRHDQPRLKDTTPVRVTSAFIALVGSVRHHRC